MSDVFAPWQQRAHDQTVAALDAGHILYWDARERLGALLRDWLAR